MILTCKCLKLFQHAVSATTIPIIEGKKTPNCDIISMLILNKNLALSFKCQQQTVSDACTVLFTGQLIGRTPSGT